MKKLEEIIKERKFKYILFFWSIISIQFVFGSNLQNKGHLFNDLSSFFIDIIKVILLSIIFIVLHYCILELIKEIKHKKQKEKIEEKQEEIKESKNKKYRWPIYFLIIFICWIPTVLAFYPCILGYDGGHQIGKYFFLNKIPHHPILITKLYTFFYAIGVKFFTPSFGMFLFSLLQMTFMAAVFSYTVKFIEDETHKKWLRNISIIFYALYPYNQLFSITTTKDVIFAGLMLIFIIYLYKMIKEKYEISDYIFIIIIGVLMLLSRNNAVYTLKVSLPILILVLIKDKNKILKVAITFILIIVIYQNANNFLYKNFNNELKKANMYDENFDIELEMVESDEGNLRLSTFAQAVGRVVRDKEESLTEEEKEKISFYFNDYKKLGEEYKTNVADNATAMSNSKNINENKKEFFKFIIELGKKYPIIYIESFLDTTRGYWYVADVSFSEIMTFKHPGAFELYDYGISKGRYKVIHNSKIPELKNLYINLYRLNKYQEIPILYILFQPGIYFYITLAFLLYSIYKRENNILVIAIVLFTFYASCYLVLCSIIRYMYPIMISTPIMLAFVVKNKKIGGEE